MRMRVLRTWLALLGGLVVVAACSMSPARPDDGAGAGKQVNLLYKPSLADFASGDRDAVAAMLREVSGKFRSPYTLMPGSRAVTILLVCRVQFVRAGGIGAGVVGVQCLSGGAELDLAVDDDTQFYYLPGWSQEQFGVTAGPVAVGEVRTCVVYGSGFGGNLWKRFLIFPGPAH